ncbi:hypothetical protein D3C80_1732850 [compost metagenome]
MLFPISQCQARLLRSLIETTRKHEFLRQLNTYFGNFLLLSRHLSGMSKTGQGVPWTSGLEDLAQQCPGPGRW